MLFSYIIVLPVSFFQPPTPTPHLPLLKDTNPIHLFRREQDSERQHPFRTKQGMIKKEANVFCPVEERAKDCRSQRTWRTSEELGLLIFSVREHFADDHSWHLPYMIYTTLS